MYVCTAVTFTLDAAYSDIASITLYAPAGVENATDGIDVWVSTSTAYNTSGVLCGSGISLVVASPAAPVTVYCPSLAGAAYVTLVRNVAALNETLSEPLAVDEVVVMRTGVLSAAMAV